MRKLITILAAGIAAAGLAFIACGGHADAPAQGFDAGTFTAGTDVEAGTYVAQHPLADGSRCEWAVLSSTGNVLGSDVTTKDHLARRVLVLTDGLTVRTSGCGLWTLQK